MGKRNFQWEESLQQNEVTRIERAIQLASEQEMNSHDAEIRRIGIQLGLAWPCTIEDIIKKIQQTQQMVLQTNVPLP